MDSRRYFCFRRKVIEIAVKEINQFTDLEVSWEPVTKGRKVIEIKFIIKTRDTWSRLETHRNATKAINKDNQQITIEEYLNDQVKEAKDDERIFNS